LHSSGGPRSKEAVYIDVPTGHVRVHFRPDTAPL
jgi:hypothetical protein